MLKELNDAPKEIVEKPTSEQAPPKEQQKDAEEAKEGKDLKDEDAKDFKHATVLEKHEKEKEREKVAKGAEKLQREHVGFATGRAPFQEQRLANLEAAVGRLSHFIAVQHRPPMERSALRQEAAVGSLTGQLQKRVRAAKVAKDAKDTEQ